MKTDLIQITYEDSTDTLPQPIEKRIVETLDFLMTELNQGARSISLFFCSIETMIQLNGTYRNREVPTDLLSWLYQDDTTGPHVPEEPWGEMVYCLAVIRKQAAASGWEIGDELLRLTVHGLTHLLGYDHESDADEAVMLDFEKKLLVRIGLEGAYDS
ncbi:rRNA maturation RNase YbeY [bacterium]|nr:rRNA maturation RNase YbeY [bacterium]